MQLPPRNSAHLEYDHSTSKTSETVYTPTLNIAGCETSMDGERALAHSAQLVPYL